MGQRTTSRAHRFASLGRREKQTKSAGGGARGPTVAKRREEISREERTHLSAILRNSSNEMRPSLFESNDASRSRYLPMTACRVRRRLARQDTSRAGRLVGATRNAAITVGIPVLCVPNHTSHHRDAPPSSSAGPRGAWRGGAQHDARLGRVVRAAALHDRLDEPLALGGRDRVVVVAVEGRVDDPQQLCGGYILVIERGDPYMTHHYYTA